MAQGKKTFLCQSIFSYTLSPFITIFTILKITCDCYLEILRPMYTKFAIYIRKLN